MQFYKSSNLHSISFTISLNLSGKDSFFSQCNFIDGIHLDSFDEIHFNILENIWQIFESIIGKTDPKISSITASWVLAEAINKDLASSIYCIELTVINIRKRRHETRLSFSEKSSVFNGFREYSVLEMLWIRIKCWILTVWFR